MATTGKAYNPPREVGIAFNAKDYADENDNIITTQEALERYRFTSTGAGLTSVALLNELATNTGFGFLKDANTSTIASLGTSRDLFATGSGYFNPNNIQFRFNRIKNVSKITAAGGFTGALNGNATTSTGAVNALSTDASQPNITTLANLTRFNPITFTTNNIAVDNINAITATKTGSALETFDTTTKLKTTNIGNYQALNNTSIARNILLDGTGSGTLNYGVGFGDDTLLTEIPQISVGKYNKNAGGTRNALILSKGGTGSASNAGVSTAIRHRRLDTAEFGVLEPSATQQRLEFQLISDYVNSAGSRVSTPNLARFRWNAQGSWYNTYLAGNFDKDDDYMIFEPYRENGVGVGDGICTFPQDVYVYGDLEADAKQFKIPHPVDDTKTLSHVAIEAPRVENMYQGLATLTDGYAEVVMDTFSKLTAGSWTAINHNACSFVSNTKSFKSVRSTITDGVLKIFCEDDTSSDIISWIVIAERNDDEIKISRSTDDNGRLITEYIEPKDEGDEEE